MFEATGTYDGKPARLTWADGEITPARDFASIDAAESIAARVDAKVLVTIPGIVYGEASLEDEYIARATIIDTLEDAEFDREPQPPSTAEHKGAVDFVVLIYPNSDLGVPWIGRITPEHSQYESWIDDIENERVEYASAD